MGKRKIIQIVIIPVDPVTILALCDDGTIWIRQDWKWTEIDTSWVSK